MKRTYVFDRTDRDCMRQMSDAEMETYYVKDQCPFCAASALDMLQGPRGGLMANLECPVCEARVNVITNIPRGVMYARFAQVIREPLPEWKPKNGSAP